MYVCICKGVSDHRIRRAVEEGARSWREVQQVTGCGTQCGKCACMGKGIARDAIKEEMLQARQDLAYAV
ncbi:(2Fe-2S)-binding protein [Halomonas cerina]|uniref:Bacterioferritin-associated ferredoxin n=1 Tax=Halomonas cerina TaxID=447424 RepID=A0A839VFN8_9GAMM|nr:(2Fe-2S)-binding protein [Halomonas cerina]MBB3191444.1 bacterioferritin-associated ferredoxin [Halomonas cerina]